MTPRGLGRAIPIEVHVCSSSAANAGAISAIAASASRDGTARTRVFVSVESLSALEANLALLTAARYLFFVSYGKILRFETQIPTRALDVKGTVASALSSAAIFLQRPEKNKCRAGGSSSEPF